MKAGGAAQKGVLIVLLQLYYKHFIQENRCTTFWSLFFKLDNRKDIGDESTTYLVCFVFMKAGGAVQKGVNKHVHFTINRHFC